MQVKHRFSAILLCFFLSAATLFSEYYIAEETNHHCTGTEDCPICLILRICHEFLSILSFGIAAAAAVPVFLRLNIRPQHCVHQTVIKQTPVSLKIKQLN